MNCRTIGFPVCIGSSVLLTLAMATFAFSQHEARLDADHIARASGVKTTAKGNVVRIEWPRNDVPVTVDGMPLKPFAGLGTWAAFTATPEGAMVMGDTVVFQDEVTPAMDAALAAGLEVTALHNHFFYDEPKVYFMHIGGHGDPEKLAANIKSVWDSIKKVRRKQPTPGKRFEGQSPQAGKIDAARIEKILNHKSQTKDGVVKVSIGKEGEMHHARVGEAMGLNTWAAFSGNDDFAVVDGDFIMTSKEVQPVLRALRQTGIHIVALHNHMIGEKPSFFFLHFWGKGPTEQLARGIKEALEIQARAEDRHGE
jgi:hypothetical protein